MARRKTLNRKLNKTRKAYRKTKYRLAKALAQIEAIKNLPKGDELPTGVSLAGGTGPVRVLMARKKASYSAREFY